MSLAFSLSTEQEAQFEAWAAQQGEAFQRDAHAVSAALTERDWQQALASHFAKAVVLTQPVLHDAAREGSEIGPYLLVLLKAITALYHAYGRQPVPPVEPSGRPPLEDALTLYELGVVPVGTAARIARISVGEFRMAADNARRIDLIRKRTREGLTAAEETELKQLQTEIRQRVDARHPLPRLASAGKPEPGHPRRGRHQPDASGQRDRRDLSSQPPGPGSLPSLCGLGTAQR